MLTETFVCTVRYHAPHQRSRSVFKAVEREAVARFRAYVAAVCPILHDVNWVVTVNEPNILALFSRMTATPEGRHA